MNFAVFFCFTGNFFTSTLEHFTFLLKLLFISFLSLLIHLEHLGGEHHKSETFLITCTLLGSQRYMSEHNNIYIYIYMYIYIYIYKVLYRRSLNPQSNKRTINTTNYPANICWFSRYLKDVYAFNTSSA